MSKNMSTLSMELEFYINFVLMKICLNLKNYDRDNLQCVIMLTKWMYVYFLFLYVLLFSHLNVENYYYSGNNKDFCESD